MKNLSRFGIYLISLLVTYSATMPAIVCNAQERHDSIHFERVVLVGGATVGAFVVGHGLLNNLWWKGQKSRFHVNAEQDYYYALNADKIGHAYFAGAAATVYSDLMYWCGMDSVTAAWTGFGVAMTYQTYIEIRDGFSADYGFSWGDLSADLLGASIPIAKHYLPCLRDFDLQISFYPSSAFTSGGYNSIIDDYQSTAHWLAFHPHRLLSRSWQEWYPPWLGLAIGHSVNNLNSATGGQHRFFVSLDFNVAHIQGLPSWLQDVLRTIHLYHLPAPAVQVYPTVVWYGLKF